MRETIPGTSPEPTLPRKKTRIADWFYIPSWKRSVSAPPAREISGRRSWLVFIDDCGLGAKLVERLKQHGHDVITVTAGSEFRILSETEFSLTPGQRDHYDTLLGQIPAPARTPTTVVHLWSLTPPAPTEPGLQSLNQGQDLGFYSLLFLAQALEAQGYSHDLHIAAISNELQDVTGQERLCPAKATILGPVKVIQQEYRNITCRSIDVVLPESIGSLDEALVDQLMAELTTASRDLVVAYRRNHRWVQTFEPVHLDEAVDLPSRLREQGVYLIIGGLGGIGLILAEYLSRKVKAKLVLVGRSQLPPREEWNRLLSGADGIGRHLGSDQPQIDRGINLNLEKESDYITQLEARITQERTIRGLKSYPALEETLNQLCAGYICNYFAISNVDIDQGRRYTFADLKNKLRLLPAFDKFYKFFLKVLSEDSVISIDDDTIQFTGATARLKQSDLLKREVRAKYPEFAGLLDLLDHCVSHYSQALSGDIEAIGVLYPDGRGDLLDETSRNTAPHSSSEIYVFLLSEIVAKVVNQSPGKKIRILEVGIGDGILTRSIVPKLANHNVEYYATDLGRSFVLNAETEARAAGLNFMKFGLLDISEDPTNQGYQSHSFDFILALDVVHATRNVRESMGHLKKLLAPGGILSLIETVKPQRWVDMIWGLSEGWWIFEDEDIRKASPLLTLDQWEEVARDQGFQAVKAYPEDPVKRSETDYGLIVAQQGEIPAGHVRKPDSNDHDENLELLSKIRRVQLLEKLGAEILIMSADVSDEEQMEAVVAQTCQRFGALHGVIHAGGVTAGGLVFNLVRETSRFQTESLFRPKVHGLYVLEQALKGNTLDFCILISSNAGILGGLGLCAYSAASAFMDAFATSRSKNHSPWISTNWDGWPTEEATGRASSFHTSIDQYAMTLEESNSAFERILSGATGQVVISSGDLQPRLDHWTKKGSDSSRDNGEYKFHGRPNLKTSVVAPRNDTEQKLADLWQEILGIDQVSIHDNFFDLDGDSLLGIQLVSRINKAFHLALPFRNLFEEPTVSSLAERIDRVRWSAQELQTLPSTPAGSQEEEGEV